MSSSEPPEEQEQHEEQQEEDQQEQQEQRWVPTHVQVTVLRGRGLRGKGRQGTSDVYTIIQVGREKYSTCVAERTTSPEWQEECSFELQPGALQGDDLVLTVMHRAAIGLDVFLGQAVIPLEKAFQDNVSAKNQAEWVNLRSRWFRLNSKTGKKEKERGEVQATVQFTRNNLTASMYHLAMKERGHSAFSKLKERMRGRKRSAADEGAPHPTPASSTTGLTAGTGASRNRLPSDGGGEEEYEDDEGGEGRRNKMRTFFLRGKLRKSSETRSSSSLGSESSESSSRGGSLSPTAGISVVVSDLSNSPSNSSNLTADNSPDHTADISPKLSPDHSEFGSECHEITIAVPSIYRNGVHHTCDTLPLRPGPGEPVALAKVSPPMVAAAKASPLGLGLLLKPLPTSLSLQNLSPRDEQLPRGGLGGGGPGAGVAGDGRRWSFDKPGEDEKAAIAAALEKSGPMVGDEEEQQQEEEEEEPSGESAPSVATGAARESYDQKQQQQQQQQKKKKNKKESAGGRDGSEPGQEKLHRGWFGSKEAHAKPSSRPPIADLFPQKPDNNFNLPRERPTSKDHAVTTLDATGGVEALAKLKQRPLPPPPADREERPSSRKCPNLFTSSMGTSQLDVDGDDPFEAFASCRLQSAAELQPETQKHLEWDLPKGPLLELWDTDKQEPLQTTNVTIDSEENKASHPQTWDICLDTFTEHSSHGFAQLLAAIPAATNRQASVLLTASLDSPVNDGGCTDTNLANYSSNTDCLTSTAPPLALCHDCQCTHSPALPCEIDKLKDCIDSSNPSSSGVGSLAEEDMLSSISSCSLLEKLPASSGKGVVETKSIEGCTLNHCEESPEPTVVSVLKDSEDKLIDWSCPLIINHNIEGNVIQVSNQNEKPQTVISMDEDQCLVPLPMISLVELQCGDGPYKEPISPHVPWSDPSSNNPNTSIPSDLELEPIQCDKTEKTEGACELQESLGGLHEPQNSSALAASDNDATVTPDIPDIEGTSICPSFHTLASFLGDESSLPIGTGSLNKQLVRQSSPKPSQLLDLNNLLAMSTPIQVFNESSLMETPFAVGSSDEQLVRQSSPNPSDPVQDLDGTPSIEKWLTPSSGSLLSSLNASTDSQHYQTCLTHNSSTETTVSVDSLVEHPSENLCSSVLTLCGAESCEDISQVLSPENVSAMELEMSMGVRETGVETILSEGMCLSEELASRLEPVFNVEDFGFHSDTLTNSDMSCNHDNNDKISGGTQEIGEEPPSDDTIPACSLARCPALQRSHSEGSLTTGLAERPLTTCGSSPCVARSLDPHDPSGHSSYSTRTPLLFLSPTSCLPAEPSAPSARCALPSTTVAALLLSSTPPPGPAPLALPSAPPSAACIAAPAPDEVRATDAGHAVDEPHAVQPPEVEEEEPQQNSPHPVRPLTPEERRAPEGRSVLEKLRSTIHPGRSGQLSEVEPERRKSMTEGAGSYYHLTHNELVALLVRREAELEAQRAEFERQTTLLSRREVELRRLKPQVRDLENYIDTLLVRIMEQTPTLLQVRSKFK